MKRRGAIDLQPAAVARGTVALPGSKSVSIRVLLLAALADAETRLTGLLRSDDTAVMIDALRTLGLTVDDDGDDVVVHGTGAFANRDVDVFVGNSGLSVRTLAAALAFSGGRSRLHGVARMHERPIGDLVDALRAAGVRVEYEGRDGYPPIVVGPATDSGSSTIRVAAHASSQFVTGLLQAAPLRAATDDVTIVVDGELISRPYVDLTIALMRRFGVDVREQPPRTFVVARGSRYASPGAFAVEGDASSASYLLAAGLVGGGPVTIDGLGRDSLQGDARFVDVIVAMGGQVAQGPTSTTVRGRAFSSGHRLRAIDADFVDMPDAAMTVAILALFADHPSVLRGIGSWRVKETDRIAAMAEELGKLGARVEHGTDWLRVEPLSPAAIAALKEHAARGEPVSISTYDDHRIAMCFALVRFAGVPVRIEDPDCVAKTFPDFFERLETLVDAEATTG